MSHARKSRLSENVIKAIQETYPGVLEGAEIHSNIETSKGLVTGRVDAINETDSFSLIFHLERKGLGLRVKDLLGD